MDIFEIKTLKGEQKYFLPFAVKINSVFLFIETDYPDKHGISRIRLPLTIQKTPEEFFDNMFEDVLSIPYACYFEQIFGGHPCQTSWLEMYLKYIPDKEYVISLELAD